MPEPIPDPSLSWCTKTQSRARGAGALLEATDPAMLLRRGGAVPYLGAGLQAGEVEALAMVGVVAVCLRHPALRTNFCSRLV